MRKSALALIVFLAALPAGAQLVTPRSSAPEILISAAGSVEGFGGVFFRSDITVINYRAADQLVRFRWLPQNAPGPDGAPTDITIGAASGIISEDFVTTILHRSGLGAILITAVTADGTFDPNGKLFATSRIWTPQPNSSGTTSQTFPTLATADIPISTKVAIVGQRRDDRYRLNIGIVNLDSTKSQTFTISVQTGGGVVGLQNVVVPAFSLVQVAVPGPASPTIQIAVENVTAGAKSGFVAYGSSVDNTTGDSWSALGFTPLQ